METVACDFCGNPDYRYITKQTDLIHNTTDEYFSIVECTDCGLSYTNPRPDRLEIGKYYDLNYSFHVSHRKLKIFVDKIMNITANSLPGLLIGFIPVIKNVLVQRIKPKIKDPIMQYYQEHGTGTLVDIGCGSGQHAHYWGYDGSISYYRKYFDIHAVETANDARKILMESDYQVYTSIEKISRHITFDVIRMNFSLEHVHSPDAYFNFFKERLSISGIIVLTVPNYEGLIYQLSPSCVELPIHLYHFRPTDIKNYASKHGLKVKYIKTFSYPEMYLFAARMGLLPKTFPRYMSYYQAKSFQNILSMFDNENLGNDMMFVLSHE